MESRPDRMKVKLDDFCGNFGSVNCHPYSAHDKFSKAFASLIPLDGYSVRLLSPNTITFTKTQTNV